MNNGALIVGKSGKFKTEYVSNCDEIEGKKNKVSVKEFEGLHPSKFYYDLDIRNDFEKALKKRKKSNKNKYAKICKKKKLLLNQIGGWIK